MSIDSKSGRVSLKNLNSKFNNSRQQHLPPCVLFFRCESLVLHHRSQVFRLCCSGSPGSCVSAKCAAISTNKQGLKKAEEAKCIEYINTIKKGWAITHPGGN